MEYYSAIKRNEFKSVVVRWMNLESLIQSQVSQKKKTNIYYCICKESRKMVLMILVGNRLVDTVGKERVGWREQRGNINSCCITQGAQLCDL